MILRAILFDLDDTLIRVEFEPFMRGYYSMLAPWLSDKCEPERFVSELRESVLVMIQNRDPSKTNEQVFCEDFFPKFGVCPADWMPAINEFYRKDFPKLRQFSRREPVAAQVVEAAVEAGYDCVLATNPVYPAQAIIERLEWAGIEPSLFKILTTYEIMHFCKPHPEYYLEIASLIGRSPGECLMAGNDVDEDLVAGTVGMKTFLVDGAVRNRGNARFTADYTGSLSDLLEFIRGNRGRK